MNATLIPVIGLTNYELISVIADFFTIIIGSLAVFLTIRTLRHRRSNLSMDVFLRALDEFGSDQTRSDRKNIYDNFLPSAHFGDDSIVDVDNIPFFQQLFSHDKKRYKRIAVRADRIGFMFFTADLSPNFRMHYIDWLCITFCGVWNRLAVHIDEERDWRDVGDRYVPYFEQIAYLCYFRARFYDNNTRIIVLDRDKLERMRELHDRWW